MFVKKQTGITLIEVLIALVVFAIGVGGMAGLQLKSLGMSVDATQRAVVLAKSQELADRIRTNATAMSTYTNTFNNSGGAFCASSPAPVCGDSNDGLAVSCSPLQLAAFDLWDVFCRTGSGLNDSVINWQTTISCTTAACDSALDTVTLTTVWVSKTADMDQDLANTAGTSNDRTIESLTLSFIP